MITYGFTLFWFLGFIEFHLKAWNIPGFAQLPLGWSAVLAFGIWFFALWRGRAGVARVARELWTECREAPLALSAVVAMVGALFVIAAWQSTYPPHHPQEFDAINYHMGLPRQHLMLSSLAHLSWSAADLWPMPIQFGFAPAWFALPWLHKVPQFFGALAAFAFLLALGRQRAPRSWRGWVPALAVFGTQGVMIQLGTAMLDLTLLYLLLAGIYAFQKKQWGWTALHVSLLATSKAFSPLQVLAVSGVSLGFLMVLGSGIATQTRAALVRVLVISIFLSGIWLARSAWVSLERAGTPLFPFLTCQVTHPPGCQGDAGEVIRESAQRNLSTRDAYGLGRGPVAWVKHLWLAGIQPSSASLLGPYDYSLGLAWPLVVLLLFSACSSWIPARKMPALGAIAISFWGIWWMGSLQARWLSPVLALGWLATMDWQSRLHAKVLLGALLISTGFSVISSARAYRGDWGRSRLEIQHEKEAAALRDPLSHDAMVQESLFYSEPINGHQPSDRTWILR